MSSNCPKCISLRSAQGTVLGAVHMETDCLGSPGYLVRRADFYPRVHIIIFFILPAGINVCLHHRDSKCACVNALKINRELSEVGLLACHMNPFFSNTFLQEGEISANRISPINWGSQPTYEQPLKFTSGSLECMTLNFSKTCF